MKLPTGIGTHSSIDPWPLFQQAHYCTVKLFSHKYQLTSRVRPSVWACIALNLLFHGAEFLFQSLPVTMYWPAPSCLYNGKYHSVLHNQPLLVWCGILFCLDCNFVMLDTLLFPYPHLILTEDLLLVSTNWLIHCSRFSIFRTSTSFLFKSYSFWVFYSVSNLCRTIVCPF